MARTGFRPRFDSAPYWEAFANLVEESRQKVLARPLEDWIDMAYADSDPLSGLAGPNAQLVRDAALRNARAFTELVGLHDDEQLPIVLKNFHVKTTNAMRRSQWAVILLPFEFGKSYLSNMLVPLMDFAEWRDATEGRIYWDHSHAVKWVRRLMDQIDFNERLHKLFPWIRRPRRGDKTWGLWSTLGFGIGGRTLADRSFETHTANQFPKGQRYARVGVDDIVDTANCKQRTVQDRLFEWLTSGAMTMRQKLTRESKYRTAWSGGYLIGTLYDHNDVNKQSYDYVRELGREYRAMRFDCYERGDPDAESIWPEYRDKAYLKQLKQDLTPPVFNMRCRNLVGGNERITFPLETHKLAEYDGVERPPFQWGVVPERTRCIIGFDPGSGKISKDSKNPAYLVYGERDAAPLPSMGLLRDPFAKDPLPDMFFHLIEWDRLEGYSFTRQCDVLAELYDRFGVPIAFENNTLQTSYADYMGRHYPQVRMVGEHTGTNVIDPVDGVEQFEPLFRHYRMVIHAAGAPTEKLRALREEFTTWKGRYCDLVMAAWIARNYFRKRQKLERKPLRSAVPGYARMYGRGLVGAYGR